MKTQLLLAIVILVATLMPSTVMAQTPFEIKFTLGSGGTWFGGDNRPDQGPRHLGQGQSVLFAELSMVEQFSFYFTSKFDYAENPVGGVETTLHLVVFDEAGTIVDEADVVVPASFSPPGWVTWTGLSAVAQPLTRLIFAGYVVGGYDTNEVWASIRRGTQAYAGGISYTAQVTSDAAMQSLSNWAPVSFYDMHFWVQGTQPVPIQENSWGKIKALFN